MPYKIARPGIRADSGLECVRYNHSLGLPPILGWTSKQVAYAEHCRHKVHLRRDEYQDVVPEDFAEIVDCNFWIRTYRRHFEPGDPEHESVVYNQQFGFPAIHGKSQSQADYAENCRHKIHLERHAYEVAEHDFRENRDPRFWILLYRDGRREKTPA